MNDVLPNLTGELELQTHYMGVLTKDMAANEHRLNAAIFIARPFGLNHINIRTRITFDRKEMTYPGGVKYNFPVNPHACWAVQIQVKETMTQHEFQCISDLIDYIEEKIV